jgi:hypothetical protein
LDSPIHRNLPWLSGLLRFPAASATVSAIRRVPTLRTNIHRITLQTYTPNNGELTEMLRTRFCRQITNPVLTKQLFLKTVHLNSLPRDILEAPHRIHAGHLSGIEEKVPGDSSFHWSSPSLPVRCYGARSGVAVFTGPVFYRSVLVLYMRSLLNTYLFPFHIGLLQFVTSSRSRNAALFAEHFPLH